MDRTREARKVSMAAPAGLTRRRHRGSGFRDSPDEDGPVELQETARPRDRKKVERERDRERSSSNKRRRGDRLMHAGNREDGPEDSTDESVNDDVEEDYEDEGGGGGSLRMLPPNTASTSSPPVTNYHQNHQRRSYSQSVPSTKMFRPPSPWKPADEMIGVHVPRKPRSASTKRAHDFWVSSSGGIIGGDQLHRQASTSPARSSLVSATASPSRISPSSPNISARKKMDLVGTNKHITPPKASSSKAPSSKQDEIEFEIAEVLYGLGRQPPGSSKLEGVANEALNKSTSDSKSRVSSPVSTAAPHQSSALLPHNGSSAMVVTVPKRKNPRPVNYGGDENVPSHSQANLTSKSDVEQAAKVETMPPNTEKNLKSGLSNDIGTADLEQSRAESISGQKADPSKLVRNSWSESKNLRREPILAGLKDEDVSSTKRDSSGNIFDENREDNSKGTTSELGIKLEEKFQIDLMAHPLAFRLSPEREGKIEYVSAEPKKPIPDLEKLKPLVKDAEKTKFAESRHFVDLDQKRFKRGVVEEVDVQQASSSKERFVELQLNTEKTDGESGMSTAVANRKLMHHQQHQAQTHLSGATRDEATKDKTVPDASSLPSAMSMAGWQGGLPSMGYMTPLQGVVSMDGSAVSSAPIQPPPLHMNQPRPKKCATHCYIARNISYHQQFTRLNPFWPAPAGSAPTLYGANPCNLNVVPPVELHCSNGVRSVNPVQDKSLLVFPGRNTSKNKACQGPNVVDTAQRKQILLQQTVPARAPTNLLRGPAFIFPLSQQQAAIAASALTTTMKNPSVAGAIPTGNPNSISGSAPLSAPATMSFNYPNMAANETQYLAILQNNPYHFPFPTHAGAPPVLTGAHPQAMPFFNGSFYSPPMLHPSQLQQQQQQTAHGHQISPGQNTDISSGSSSSQKNLQNHSQKPQQGIASSAGSANLKQSFPSPKNRPSQLPLQQQNQHLNEAGSGDSPSTADSRSSRSNLGTEGRSLPIHVQNFSRTSASSVSVGGGTGTINGVTNGNHHKNGNHSDKKLQQQQQGLKVGVDSLPSHKGFAVSFGSLNGGGGPPALDMASMGQNHANHQNFPEAARHSYQVMAAAAQQAHQNKNFRSVDEVRKGSGGDASKVEEERKSVVTKNVLSNVGLSIAFSRSDLADSANNVDGSSRNLKVGSGPSRTSGPLLSTSISNANSLNSQQQQQQQQQQQLQNQQLQQQQQKPQLIQLHKQPQQYMASAARGNTTSASNGNVQPDNLPNNAAMAAKSTNSMSAFQQNHAPICGGSSSPTQSPQWKNSARTSLPQVPPSVLASSNSASIKSHYQQQSQPSQQSRMQISFGGGNQKTLTAVQGQQHPKGHQGPSQIMVGSPAATSNYNNGGSPKTTTASMVTNKAPQASTLSSSTSLQVKNSSMLSRSSSPVGAGNFPSAAHGNSNIGMSQGNSGSNPQMLQQQQQMKPQLPKQAMQHTQTLFPSYMQTSQGPNSFTAANSGNHQRRRPETQSVQHSLSSCGSSSTGMLSMCSSAGAVTSDPTKANAVAAAAGGKKAASHGTTSNGSGQQQHLPSSFAYMHIAPPAVVQAKPAQQKQQTGGG